MKMLIQMTSLRAINAMVFLFLLFVPVCKAADGELEGPAIVSAGSAFSYVLQAESEADEMAKAEFTRIKQTNPAAVPPTDFDTSSIIQREVSRSGPLIKSTIVSKSGKRYEIWKTESATVVKNPSENDYYVHKGTMFNDLFTLDLGKFGYCHGSWIAPEFYVGKVKLDGKEALYFCNPKPPPGRSQAFTKVPPDASQAWIDPDTRKPLCIKENQCTYRYTHLPPVALGIPKGAEDALKKEQLRQALVPIPHHP